MERSEEQSVYRLEGLTCTSCAAKFERNVCELPGVTDAKVNFGAAKLTVTGIATVAELEEAGAFDQIQVRSEGQAATPRVPFWQKKENLLVLCSTIFLLGGFVSNQLYGEKSLLSIVLFLSSILIGGWGLFREGIRNLIRLQFDMKTLMTIAILGAAAIGEWGEGATVVILFAISEALESYSMDRARRSIQSLLDISPKQALVVRDGVEQLIEVEKIEIGDILLIQPGKKIAMDGVVQEGSSHVQQASITGESIPVEKKVGDEVYAGTLNEEGLLRIQVTKRVEDTTLARIIQLVEDAQAEKAPAQAFVDRFARYYTPAILLIGLLIALVPPLFTGEWQEWIYRGLSILVVGCPCALVISTPVAIVTAIGNAAKHGVLVKGGVYLEELGRIEKIAFDKTGTLTQGKPVVTDWENIETVWDKQNFQIAVALERNSTHPLASAIVRFGEKQLKDSKSLTAENFVSITGSGVQAEMEGVTYILGKPRYWPEDQLDLQVRSRVDQLQSEGKTVMLLGTLSQILSIIAVRDEIRSSSKQAIKQLDHLGLKQSVLLTGDNEQTAQAIAKELGINEVHAELLPEQKLEVIKETQKEHSIAMVGDGVNDAPALAAATVGIAMGGAGTDTALETADLALMGDDLQKLPFAIRLSRKTMTIIKQNIAFALGIKLLALFLIIPGFLTLWLAVFADMGGTLIVTLNALRLLQNKENL